MGLSNWIFYVPEEAFHRAIYVNIAHTCVEEAFESVQFVGGVRAGEELRYSVRTKKKQKM